MEEYFKHKYRSGKFGAIAGWIILGAIAIIGFALLFGFALMHLWNWLMPELFGLGLINYWQAVGVFVLAKMLFGGFGSCSSGSKKGKRNKCQSRKGRRSKKDFSQWKFYEEFWEKEGKSAYKDYIQRNSIEKL